MILWLGSGAERLEVVGLVHLDSGGGVIPGAGGEGDAGAGQDLEAEVAASFGPLVVLLGQYRARGTFYVSDAAPPLSRRKAEVRLS